jgi:hypothetical protein
MINHVSTKGNFLKSFDHQYSSYKIIRDHHYYLENPEFIVNAKFSGVDSDGIYAALSEVYFDKTGKLIPEIEDYDSELQGDKIEERGLADSFPKLWDKFLIN